MKRILSSVDLPFDYELRAPENARHLYLLLHGFGQVGKVIYDKVMPVLPADVAVLAPNAPYLIPEKLDGKYRIGGSWYFYDPSTKEYFIDMNLAVQFLVSGVERLGFAEWPKTLIGFSQGGYLAPFAAQKLKAVDRVVVIGGEFLPDEIEGPVPFRVDGICGDEDKYFTAEEARAGDRGMRSLGIAGELVVVPGAGHGINDDVRAALRDLLAR